MTKAWVVVRFEYHADAIMNTKYVERLSSARVLSCFQLFWRGVGGWVVGGTFLVPKQHVSDLVILLRYARENTMGIATPTQ